MRREVDMQRRLEERMKELLQHANYRKVADALGLTRAQVSRYAKGESVTFLSLQKVQAVMRPDLPPPDIEEEPRPEWARALPDDVADAVLRRLGSQGSPLVAASVETLERLGLLPAAGLPEESEGPRDERDTRQQPSEKPASTK